MERKSEHLWCKSSFLVYYCAYFPWDQNTTLNFLFVENFSYIYVSFSLGLIVLVVHLISITTHLHYCYFLSFLVLKLVINTRIRTQNYLLTQNIAWRWGGGASLGEGGVSITPCATSPSLTKLSCSLSRNVDYRDTFRVLYELT